MNISLMSFFLQHLLNNLMLILPEDFKQFVHCEVKSYSLLNLLYLFNFILLRPMVLSGD